MASKTQDCKRIVQEEEKEREREREGERTRETEGASKTKKQNTFSWHCGKADAVGT
jgi:hypothetical protein